MLKENKLFNFFTGIPFLMVVLLGVTVVSYFIFITPKYNFVLNSQVLTRDSYLKKCHGNDICFKFRINVFPELQKSTSFQSEISTIELQRALLKKEIKLFDNLKKSKNYKQSLFDIAVWYIATSGINKSFNDLIVNRSARLLAGYYYLKVFNNKYPDNIETKLLEKKLAKFINNNIIFRKFYYYLTVPLSKNYEVPASEDEKIQNELFEQSFIEYTEVESISSLCKHFDDRLSKLKYFEKYAYLLATRACYKDLEKIQPDSSIDSGKIEVLSKQIDSYKFKISNKKPEL